ncbi:MAG: hypothetical protein E6R08_04015 [Nevskiaceae bacterium]|nr:MAG: hypothetical protein E6R08_04015 [Nevskiaceae bacterium]TXH34822.1 MAG: hypothetical protein E6Q98_18245 [Rhodospirillaceae bacterium]
MPAWALDLLAWIIQALAGPVAAREAGKQEAKIEQLEDITKVQHDQLEKAAQPRLDRDGILQRMRDGKL